MAYRETSIMDVWDVIRRWHNRQGIRQIARSTGYDRKTVKGYIRLALSIGLSLEKPLPDKEEVLRLLHSTAGASLLGRTPQAQTLLFPHLDEIAGLINPDDKDLALKAKTAFSVLCERHPNLVNNVSYTSYKRFVRIHKLAVHPQLATCRIEVEPGREAQVDYARVGKLFDPVSGRMRILYSFIATLSHSRMKYVELTFSQDQTSFVCSHLRSFEFFGGIPHTIIIDNLKSGVIKPDLYDPKLNKTYSEMIDHYGCFIDTARVRHPKDKGKVERDVQTVREAVRMMLVQNPGIGLSELNRLMKDWTTNSYGQKEHGTTRERPYTVLCERERSALKPLPADRFVVAEWKQATVHPDHYIQFRGKAYSVPHAYVGKTVWIRATERILQAFSNDQLIKQHVITKAYRHTDFNDFPENVRAALDTSFLHRTLLKRASRIGPVFRRLIGELLSAHAFINLRKCQGLVAIAETTGDAHAIERASALIEDHGLKATPQEFRRILAKLATEASTPNVIPLSEATSEFIRDIAYFINNERSSS